MIIDAERVAYWAGKPIDEYSKKELIGIISVLAKAIDSLQKQHSKDLDFLLGPAK